MLTAATIVPLVSGIWGYPKSVHCFAVTSQCCAGSTGWGAYSWRTPVRQRQCQFSVTCPKDTDLLSLSAPLTSQSIWCVPSHRAPEDGSRRNTEISRESGDRGQ